MSEPAVKVTRGPVVESVHRADVVVADNTGRVLFWLGDPEKLTFWRSGAKRFHHPHVINRRGETVGRILPEFTLHSGGASDEGE